MGGEIQLTDALQKLDSIYEAAFEGRPYDISNRFEWLKTSIEFAQDDDEFRDDLASTLKTTFRCEKDMTILEGSIN